jgi:hypothetical protein
VTRRRLGIVLIAVDLVGVIGTARTFAARPDFRSTTPGLLSGGYAAAWRVTLEHFPARSSTCSFQTWAR